MSKRQQTFTKHLKKVVDDNKNESLKEAKTTDSEVASDVNKSKVKDNFGTSNEKTDIIESVPGLNYIDDNGIGVNYDENESDVIDDDCNNNNVNKPLLNDYYISQYMTSQTSNANSYNYINDNDYNIIYYDNSYYYYYNYNFII